MAAEGGEDQPVGWKEIGSFDLAAQDGDLVPKGQNLKLQFLGRALVRSIRLDGTGSLDTLGSAVNDFLSLAVTIGFTFAGSANSAQPT